jgi:hypothetical protein
MRKYIIHKPVYINNPKVNNVYLKTVYCTSYTLKKLKLQSNTAYSTRQYIFSYIVFARSVRCMLSECLAPSTYGTSLAELTIAEARTSARASPCMLSECLAPYGNSLAELTITAAQQSVGAPGTSLNQQTCVCADRPLRRKARR